MESISLLRIVEAFNAPVNEEQAWAVCYQSLKYFELEVESGSWKRLGKFSSLSAIELLTDGTVKRIADNTENQSKCGIAELLRCLGLVLFHALDYGLSEQEEQTLSKSLQDLIQQMTSLATEEDEGIEEEDPRGVIQPMIQICEQHLESNRRSLQHYKAVCRALVTEALELITFLQKVTVNKEHLKSATSKDDVDSSLEELQSSDWARLWIQLMHELRDGVKLKKVSGTLPRGPSPLSEYALTPYEMLMKDIRDKRFQLKSTPPLDPVTKRGAHDLILDFIRSRPPLRPAKERVLKEQLALPADPREELLREIRSEPQLRATPTHTPLVSPLTEARPGEEGTPSKKLIKPNFTLHFDSDESDSGSDEEDRKKVAAQPFSPGTPLSPDNVKEKHYMMTAPTSPLPLPPASALPASPLRDIRASVRRSASLIADRPQRSGPVKALAGSLPMTEQCARLLAQPAQFHLATGKSAVECLSLTVEEVMHIRKVLTKAELETLLINRPVYDLVANRKLCFTCRKTKFSWFSINWPTKCSFCDRSVCSDCVSKMQIPTHHFERIPVYTLCPTPAQPPTCKDDTAVYEKPGSAPSSPKLSRHSFHGVRDLPSGKPAVFSDPKPRRKVQRSQTLRSPSAERPPILTGPLMDICRDCKAMVINIIKSSRIALAQNAAREKGGNPDSIAEETVDLDSVELPSVSPSVKREGERTSKLRRWLSERADRKESFLSSRRSSGSSSLDEGLQVINELSSSASSPEMEKHPSPSTRTSKLQRSRDVRFRTSPPVLRSNSMRSPMSESDNNSQDSQDGVKTPLSALDSMKELVAKLRASNQVTKKSKAERTNLKLNVSPSYKL